MWMRLAVYSDVAELPTHQGVYRRHEVSMSKSAYANAGIEDLVACLSAFDEVLTTHREAIEGADRLQAMAHRACARRMVGRASTLYDTGAKRDDHVSTLLDLAARTDPGVTRSAIYAKFRLRQVIGYPSAAAVARLRSTPRLPARRRATVLPLTSTDPWGTAGRARVAVVLVTYNRAAVLSETLCALRRQSRPVDQVVVVDNASTDETLPMLRREFPEAVLLPMAENAGFGAGLAAGMQHAVTAGADFCWLLDDDSAPDSHALAALMAALEAVPTAGVAGYSGGALRLGVPERRPLERTSAVTTVLDGIRVYRRDWCLVDGALVPRRTMQAVGYPRSDFFMMMEDVEYTGRIRRSGVDVLVLQPDLISRAHLGSTGPAQSPVPWREYYQTRNHLIVALDHRSGRELAGWALRQARFVLADGRTATGRNRLGFRLRGAVDGARGVRGRTLLPTGVPNARPTGEMSDRVT
jgi:GT2 family glycosyltransferase